MCPMYISLRIPSDFAASCWSNGQSNGWSQLATSPYDRPGARCRGDDVTLESHIYSQTRRWGILHSDEQRRQYYKNCVQFYCNANCVSDRAVTGLFN